MTNHAPKARPSKLAFYAERDAAQQTDFFLSARQVRWRYGDRSDMWLWRILKNDPTFPRPLIINGRRYFACKRLEAWERDRAGKSREVA
jgi:hypothetical protein